MREQDRSREVSLGCGSLILIAIIVLIFRGKGTAELERKVDELHTDVLAMRAVLDAQHREIVEIRKSVAAQPSGEKDK